MIREHCPTDFMIPGDSDFDQTTPSYSTRLRKREEERGDQPPPVYLAPGEFELAASFATIPAIN